MKPAYSNLSLTPGAKNAGICSINVIPKEWLASDPIVDFNTNTVSTIALVTGKSWIELGFTPVSYDYNEKPKSGKSGPFFEVSITGQLNNYDADAQQTIETIRYYELVAVVMDVNKNKKLAGSTAAGLVLSFTNRKTNSSSGQETIQIDLVMECEELPPFYTGE